MLRAHHISRNSDTTLVLLHGVAGRKEQLEPLWNIPYDILALDLPGRGNDTPPAKNALDAFTTAYHETLAHHDINKYVLVGYSLGGYLAQHLVTAGEAPAGLVLISTGATLPRNGLLKQLRVVDRTQDLLEEYQPLITRLIDRYRDLRGQGFEIADTVDLRADLSLLRALQEQDYADALADKTIPALIIHGAHDHIIPPEYGRRLADALPHSTYRELDADHVSILVDPQTRRAITEHVVKNC